MYNIIFSKQASENLEEIRDYISLDNSIIAEKVLESILHTINYLSIFPNLGPKVGKYHELVEPVHKYQIRYRIDKKTVYIILIYKFKNYEI